MKELKYTLKVWQTAALAAPAVIAIYSLLLHPANIDLQFSAPSDAISFCVFAYILGTIVTIPCALILWLTALLVNKYISTDAAGRKVLLSLIAFILTLAPFTLFGFVAVEEMPILISYVIAIIAGIWYYPLATEIDETLAGLSIADKDE